MVGTKQGEVNKRVQTFSSRYKRSENLGYNVVIIADNTVYSYIQGTVCITEIY